MTPLALCVTLSVLFLAGVWWLTASAAGGQEPQEPRREAVAIGFGAMLLVRIAVAVSIEGYAPDVQTFRAWAQHAARDFSGFYSSGIFADYPPGYIYVLFLVGKLQGLLHMGDDSKWFLALLKMPAIMADLATAFVLYRVARSERNPGQALAIALIYGLNPAILVNSAAWGQVDAVFTLCIAASVVCVTGGRLTGSAVWFVLALLIKPQALIYSPLFLCAALSRTWFDAVRHWKQILLSGATATLILLAAIAPFAVREGPGWIFHLYGTTLASYPYASLNAFNLFALSGGNFVPETDSWILLSYRTWGAAFIAVTAVASLAVFGSCRHRARYACTALFLICAVFTFSSKMHERYLFPALIFALLTHLYTGDRKWLFLYAGYSVTHFLNVAYVLLESMHGNFHIPRLDPVLMTISAINLTLFGGMTALGLGATVNTRERDPENAALHRNTEGTEQR